MGAHLGQHFLTSEAAVAAMISAADVKKGDTVLEVGPGKGVLTKALLKTGAKVIAIEKDSGLVKELEDELAAEIKSRQLELQEADVRDFEAEERDKYKLVANIPYYISGEILRKFLTTCVQPASITLLVQKEVAERIARDKKGSMLSMSVRAYGEPKYIKTVKAGSFSPPPKVDSAILHIAGISRDKFTDAGVDEREFFSILKQGFANKRKKLKNNLQNLKVDDNLRAEDLSLNDWFKLVKRASASQEGRGDQ